MSDLEATERSKSFEALSLPTLMVEKEEVKVFIFGLPLDRLNGRETANTTWRWQLNVSLVGQPANASAS
jgi:RNase H-fold protein (predicted Holliday junction resolvase)